MLSTLKSFLQRNAAIRIAAIYALFSALWILFSDQILLLVIRDARTLTGLQTLKGWTFIFITALVIYWLLDREILKAKQSESAARESERKLATLMDNLPGMAYRGRNDESRTMEFVSSGCSHLTDYQPADLLQNRLIAYADLIHPEDRQPVRNQIQESLSRGQPFRLTYRLRTATGQEKWVWEQGRGIFANGAISAQEGLITDISDQKQAEEALNRYRDHLEDLVKERTLTLKQEILDRQRAEEKIHKSYHFETTINTVLKISLQPLSLEEQLDRILEAILAVPLLSLERRGSIFLVEEEPEILVLKAQRGYAEQVLKTCGRVPFGECLCGKAARSSGPIFATCLTECHRCYRDIIPHGHYCIPILTGDQVLGLLNLMLREGHRRDPQEEGFLSSAAATLAGIIELKRTEREKERLQQQLLESERISAQARMLANVAHEIRNPLTALGGLARRLDRRIPDGGREKEYARVIVSEAARLERILHSVLTLTKGPSPVRENADLNEVIAETLRPFAESFQKKSIELRSSFDQIPPVPMNRAEVGEAIGNLLGNALYSTPAGGRITIGTGKEYIEGKIWVTVKITDTGKGIPEEILGMIFEPFFTTRPVGPEHGLGLGLPIARKTMEEHGGRIRVESRPGQGATFTLSFPVPAGPPAD